MSVASELSLLASTKADIAAAIIERGGGEPAGSSLYDAEVEYLNSTGSEYIDLSSLIPSSKSFKIEIKWCPLATNNDRWICGAANAAGTSNRNRIGVYSTSSGGKVFSWLCRVSSSAVQIYQTPNSTVTTYTSTNEYIVTNSTWSNNETLYLFCQNWNGVNGKIVGRVYYLKMFDSNNNLIHHLVPVRAGVVGYMYDRIGNTLHGNAATGGFEVGPDVPSVSEVFGDYGGYVRAVPSAGGWDDYDWTDEESTWCVFINLDGGIERVYSKQQVQASSFGLPKVPPHPLSNDTQLSGVLVNPTWNWSLSEIKAATRPMVVGPLYDTVDKKTWFVVDIPSNGYVLHLYPPQATTAIRVDWGDGSEVFAPSATNFGTVEHTYSSSGRYVIKSYMSNGSLDFQWGYGNVPISGQYDAATTFKDQMLYRYIFKMNTAPFGLNSVVNMTNLRYLTYHTLPKSTSTSFGRWTSLKAVAFNRGLTYLNEGGAYAQWNQSPSVKAIALPSTVNYNHQTAPGTGVKIFRQQVARDLSSGKWNMSQSYCQDHRDLKYFHVPGACMLNNAFLFANDWQLEVVEWDSYMASETFTTIGAQTFDGCRKLRELRNCNMSAVSTIGNYAFRQCNCLFAGQDLSFPACTTLGQSAFEEVPLRSISLGTAGTSMTVNSGQTFRNCRTMVKAVIKGQPSQIVSSMFENCRALVTVDLSSCTSVPTLQNVNAFASTPSLQRIIVPDSLYTSWKAASNWSSSTNNIVNCIVRASDVPSDLSSLAAAAGMTVTGDTTVGDFQEFLGLSNNNTVQDAIDAVL